MRPWHCLAIIAAAVLLTFSNSLPNGLVGFDDTATLTGELGGELALRAWAGELGSNPLAAVPRLFTRRQLTNLSKAVDLAVWGDDWWGHHLTNVLLHLGAAWLAYFVAAAVLGSPAGALAAALVFALHPLQAEAVAYLGGRRDVLSGLLSLASFLLWLRGRRKAAFALWIAALSAKQSAVTLPLLWLAAGGGGRAVYALAGLCTAALVVRQAGFESDLAVWHGGSPLSQLSLEPRVLLNAARLLVWPFGLKPDYNGAFGPGSGIPAAMALAALALAAWFFARKHKPVALGLLWIAVTYAPMIHFLPTMHNLESFSEHWLYLPVFGVALIAGWAVRGRPALIGLVVVFAFMTWRRNPIWRDARTFWTEAARACPACARPRSGLAQVALQAGDRSSAERLYREAIDLDPKDPRPYISLAGVTLESGRLDEAERLLRRARELPLGRKSFNQPIQHHLGLIDLRRGKYLDALRRFRSNRSPETAHAAGWAWQRLGDKTTAENRYRSSLAGNPTYLPALLDLAALVPAEEAAGLLARAERLAPGSIGTRVALARALTATGDYSGAHARLMSARRAAPNWSEVWTAQAELDLKRGFRRAAVKSAERAVELDNSGAAYRVLAEARSRAR